MSAGATETYPFCGACGWDASRANLGADMLCDACGAELSRFWGGLTPPLPVATPAVASVSFAITDAPDTQDVRYRLDGGDWVLDDNITTPYVVAAAGGEVVDLQVRQILDGVVGPWSATVSGSEA